MEPNEIDLSQREVINPVLPTFRPLYDGILITNGGYDRRKGNDVIAEGQAELVSFGRPFIANPDLPKRLQLEAALNEPDPATFYGRGAEGAEVGYTDYPTLDPGLLKG